MSWPLFHATLCARVDTAFRLFAESVGRAGASVHEPPADGGWSVAQVAEHAALTNRYLLILVEKIAAKSRARAQRGAELSADPPRVTALERLSERDFAWEAPQHMVPSTTVDLARAIAELAEQHARCRAWLSEFPDGAGSLHSIRMAVAENARLDLYQFLAFVALHLERHARQIERRSGRADQL